MPKKTNLLDSKIMKEKNSSFIIYADFESILVPEDNGKENPEEPLQTNIKKILPVVMAIN